MLTGRALILSGAGRYADPWHPFRRTSERLAVILHDEGLEVEIADDVDARLAALGRHEHPDLLVVNVGDPALNHPELDDPEADAAARAGLARHVAERRPVLALHVSVTSLRGVPEWAELLGATWERGRSMHPEYGRAAVRVHPERHAIVAGLDDFSLDDERYAFLRLAPDIVPLAEHDHEGVAHPVLWAREVRGTRVVYDALGHDEASYDAPEHRLIVARAAHWLLRGAAEA